MRGIKTVCDGTAKNVNIVPLWNDLDIISVPKLAYSIEVILHLDGLNRCLNPSLAMKSQRVGREGLRRFQRKRQRPGREGRAQEKSLPTGRLLQRTNAKLGGFGLLRGFG